MLRCQTEAPDADFDKRLLDPSTPRFRHPAEYPVWARQREAEARSAAAGWPQPWLEVADDPPVR